MQRMLLKELKWTAIIWKIVYNYIFIWHVRTFLISVDIPFDFEMKRKKEKKFIYFRKKKKIGTRPSGIEVRSADSNSDAMH